MYLDVKYQKEFKGPFTNRLIGTDAIKVVVATDDF